MYVKAYIFQGLEPECKIEWLFAGLELELENLVAGASVDHVLTFFAPQHAFRSTLRGFGLTTHLQNDDRI